MVLTAISQFPDVGLPGQLVGSADAMSIGSFINNQVETAGVYDLVFTAVNSATYTIDAYGYHFSFTADGSATAAEIRDGLQALMALQPGFALRMSSVDSGSNLRLTELDPGLYGNGTPSGNDANTAITVVTAHGEEETIPAGVFVAKGTGDADCKLIRSSSATVLGAVMHQHKPVSSLDPDARAGYPPYSQLGVVSLGKMLVAVEEAVTPASTPYIRFAAGAGGTQLGALRASADSTTAMNASAYVKILGTQATAGGLVAVQIMKLI